MEGNFPPKNGSSVGKYVKDGINGGDNDSIVWYSGRIVGDEVGKVFTVYL